MSEAVERRIVAMLSKPLVCPHGNPIPGLEDLGLPFSSTDDSQGLVSLSAAVEAGAEGVTVSRISEQLQPDADLMHVLNVAGIRPGRRVSVTATRLGLDVWQDGVATSIDRLVGDHIFVRVPAVANALVADG